MLCSSILEYYQKNRLLYTQLKTALEEFYYRDDKQQIYTDTQNSKKYIEFNREPPTTKPDPGRIFKPKEA